MLKFIIKKLLMMIPMLLVISFIVYYGLQLTGIDPINFMVSPEMLSSNKENVEALRESLGLNDPLIVQYFRWLGNILHGDLKLTALVCEVTDKPAVDHIIEIYDPVSRQLQRYEVITASVDPSASVYSIQLRRA